MAAGTTVSPKAKKAMRAAWRWDGRRARPFGRTLRQMIEHIADGGAARPATT